MPDTRIFALDMDGTLLTPDNRIPDEFWDLLPRAHHSGDIILPASGRQLITLQGMFPDIDTFIAENGGVVYHQGEIISVTAIPAELVQQIIDVTMRAAEKYQHKADIVLCTPQMAFTTITTPEIYKYYHATTMVDDFTDTIRDHAQEIVKIAINYSGDSEAELAPALEAGVNSSQIQIAISGQHWVDLMDSTVNKGTALMLLADTIGVDHSNTIAFGDYLNDYELLQEAGTAYAMANAHPQLQAIADHIAPSHADRGVITVLDNLLPKI